MTWKLQLTFDASGIQWPALKIQIPCMAHGFQLAFGVFMNSFGSKGHTKSLEAHKHKQQFGEKQSVEIVKSQRLRKEGNTRINKVSAMRSGLAMRIEKVCISRNFESPDIDLHIAANACCINYTHTWLSKGVHWLSKNQGTNSTTAYCAWENMVEFDTGVAWGSLPVTRIHLGVATESKTQWLLAIGPNTGWMDYHPASHGSVKAIPILDPLNIKIPFSGSASRYHYIQLHFRLYGWLYVTFSSEEYSMDRRLILRHEVCSTEDDQVLCSSYSNNRSSSHFSTQLRFFPHVVIV